MDNKQASDTIDKIISLMMDLKVQLMSESPKSKEPQNLSVQSLESTFDSFESLKSALNSTKWPEAVNPHLICDPNSKQDKLERGRGIIELMIEEDLANMKFLDFGCGEGYTSYLAADYKTTMSVGYDIAKNNSWNDFSKKPNLTFTSDFDYLKQLAPFDVIVLFDVLDHLKNDTPVGVLTKIKDILSDKGKIYIRTHPFTSRHGTHLYNDLNKAYLHLVFTPEELKQIIPNSKYEEPSIGVTMPIMTYEKFIKESGLKILNRRDITEKVEPFFKIPKIAERVMANTKCTFFPEFQMSLQFIDIIAVKN